MSKEKRVSLVMLSGGVDSVYSLFKILNEMDDEILVHHMHLVNKENRHIIEAESCKQVMAYCRQHFGDIPYTESTVDHSMFSVFGFDSFIVSYMAGVVARNHAEQTGKRISRWIWGYCIEEQDSSDPAHYEQLENICAVSSYPFEPPVRECISPILSKAGQADYMPEELVHASWSCRSPVWTAQGPQECGVCHTCKVMIPIRDKYPERVSENL
ncbi:MAG: hypothetical protein GY815_03045 [Gammaproteobacteria bacterium]|nr:hypothetical protein [Gammaproteobacteria bacterium]